MAYFGNNRRREDRRRAERRERRGLRPRPLGCLWLVFWAVLIIVLLGLLFGGYHKGTKVSAPYPGSRASIARAVESSSAP